MATTELTLVNGDRYRIEGSVEELTGRVVDAARGSILQLARVVEVDSGRSIAINPHHVVALRSADDSV